mmetsp:Transcript_34287/g.41020  ORF Transcript_34287/g.41020 Transcript_34287/m.41020 type:complete len:328 (-) Transcript_34287:73-1056(-)|eukprot:CAMPEP_0198255186 /NCGR_PEP_ID=MMETSP1447-20131203/5367_1 /TAXON_ID=420782 /ORGANISM="Chaetoceros dichaeta, Strain CCMP1751" /LENGTH=327 /DNA_ID=CAMNT_0043941501 /DNA_START=33 /DNA_END=1016 /DNA_ORIENTATION=-
MTTPSDLPPQPQPPTQFQWKQCMELGYADGPDSNDDMADPVCFYCGKETSQPSSPSSSPSTTTTTTTTATALSRCAKCHVVTYCSRDCQVANWKKGSDDGDGLAHKFTCSAYKRVGTDMILTYPDDKESARQDFFHRIRFYASPYFIHKSRIAAAEHYPSPPPPSQEQQQSPQQQQQTQKEKNERGFLFVQSDSTLAEMSLPKPILANGIPMTKPRAVLLHYLTVQEYIDELCRDDFELVAVSGELQNAISECEVTDDARKRKEYVVLMRFRCGHVAVGIVPLVPDYGLCVMLGEQYYGSGAGEEGKDDAVGGGHGAGAVQLYLDDI